MGDFAPAALKRPLWIRFDQEDRDTPAPYFCLPDIDRRKVCLSDFRGHSNLVLYFVHEACESCGNLVVDLAEHAAEYQAAEARIIVILPGTVGEQADFSHYRGLSVLFDPDGEVRQSYASLVAEGLVSRFDDMLFVLDAYGAPYAVLLGAELHKDRLHTDTIAWLEFISVQCPE